MGGWWSNSVSGFPPVWDTLEKRLHLFPCRLVVARTDNFAVTLSLVRVYIMACNECYKIASKGVLEVLKRYSWHCAHRSDLPS
jgi:hypothetical protein